MRRREEMSHDGVPEKLARFRREEWPVLAVHRDPFLAHCGVEYSSEEQFWDARHAYEEETGYDFGWPYGDNPTGNWPPLPDIWDERTI